jgi:hypothetical protein
LGDQWYAENGPRPTLADVGVGGKFGLGKGIVQHDAFVGAQDVLEDRLWQHGRGQGLIAEPHDDRVTAGRGPRLDPRSALVLQDQ